MKFTIFFLMIFTLTIHITECTNNRLNSGNHLITNCFCLFQVNNFLHVLDDACVNEMICFTKHRMPIRIKSKQLSLFIHTECKCTSNIYRNKCGNGFCVKDKSDCDDTKLIYFKRDEAISLGIRKCD